MRLVWRTILLLAVFAGVWKLTAWEVLTHVANEGRYQSQVRLSAAIAGVTVGGAVTVFLGIWLAMRASARKNRE